MIGRSLEALLQAAGYDARFQPDLSAEELGGLLADSSLLLVAPDLSAEHRKAFLDVILHPVAPVKIPILELLPANTEQHAKGNYAVRWPCLMEELKRVIDTALLAQE